MTVMDVMIDHSREKSDEAKKKEPRTPTRRSPSKTQDQEDNDLVTQIYTDYALYFAAKNGNLVDFKRVLDQISAAESTPSVDILSGLSPTGTTYLQVAAKYRNEDIVSFIASMNPSLLLAKNFSGETVLHLAAKAGDEFMVKSLLQIGDGSNSNSLLMAENDGGNTALLEALISGRESIAEYLIKKDPELSYHQNKNGEFALYLAAKAGFVECVSLIQELCTNQEHLSELSKKKSPIAAAIWGKHTDVIEAILKKNPRSIEQRDDAGRTPLHFAASSGYLEEARYLLRKCAQNATKMDKKGLVPIHVASIEGHVDIITLLLQAFPDSGEVVDIDGSNILHLAAKNGRLNVIKLVLMNPNLEYLINMKDKNGDTPLHLATRYWHPKIVHALTWIKGVDIKAINNNGMTALDIAEYHMPDNTQYRQRLTWAALKAAGTPRSLLSTKVISKKKSFNADKYKDRVNTLLLVATLVATVTFAAGFTMPGGYISSDSSPDLGMATMLRKSTFHMFVFCDTIAMYSSIIVVLTLIWAQLGDLTLILNALTLAVPLLGIALIMMSMAFTSGVFIVVSKLRWLSSTILAMSIFFVTIILFILVPLCTPLSPRNEILRYLSYYPFYLLILACSST